jgi:hypothetical protein
MGTCYGFRPNIPRRQDGPLQGKEFARMKASLKPHILSTLALGIFCILAAGSMDNESKSVNLSTGDQLTEMSKKDVAFALHCVLDSEQEWRNIYVNHPDWIANPIDVIAVFEKKGNTENRYGIVTIGFQGGRIAPSHVGIGGTSESDTDSYYIFAPELPLYDYEDKSNLGQQTHNSETNYQINRDTLKMTASHARSYLNNDEISYTCSKMDKEEAPSFIIDARNAIVPFLEAKQRSKEQEKQQETNRHQF